MWASEAVGGSLGLAGREVGVDAGTLLLEGTASLAIRGVFDSL